MAYTHNVFEPKQMASLNVDSLVRTVVLTADVDNGTAVVIGNPGTTIFSEVEIGACSATKASAVGDVIAVIDGDGNSLADGYDVGLVDPRGFYNLANKATRARVLVAGDEFAIPTAAINGTFVAQPYVVVDITGGQEGKFELADSVEGYAFAGKILSRAIPVLYGATKVDFTLIRVIRNSADANAQYVLTPAANVLAEDTVDGSDAGTTQALANALKVTVNAILTALKAAGLMAADE